MVLRINSVLSVLDGLIFAGAGSAGNPEAGAEAPDGLDQRPVSGRRPAQEDASSYARWATRSWLLSNLARVGPAASEKRWMVGTYLPVLMRTEKERNR